MSVMCLRAGEMAQWHWVWWWVEGSGAPGSHSSFSRWDSEIVDVPGWHSRRKGEADMGRWIQLQRLPESCLVGLESRLLHFVLWLVTVICRCDSSLHLEKAAHMARQSAEICIGSLCISLWQVNSSTIALRVRGRRPFPMVPGLRPQRHFNTWKWHCFPDQIVAGTVPRQRAWRARNLPLARWWSVPSVVHCQISASFGGTLFPADTARSLSLCRYSLKTISRIPVFAAPMPGTEFEGLWHNSEIVGPGCHRPDRDHGFMAYMWECKWLMLAESWEIARDTWFGLNRARFPNGTMITGVFENHGATGEARWSQMMPSDWFWFSACFGLLIACDRARRSGRMAACIQAGSISFSES